MGGFNFSPWFIPAHLSSLVHLRSPCLELILVKLSIKQVTAGWTVRVRSGMPGKWYPGAGCSALHLSPALWDPRCLQVLSFWQFPLAVVPLFSSTFSALLCQAVLLVFSCHFSLAVVSSCFLCPWGLTPVFHSLRRHGIQSVWRGVLKEPWTSPTQSTQVVALKLISMCQRVCSSRFEPSALTALKYGHCRQQAAGK